MEQENAKRLSLCKSLTKPKLFLNRCRNTNFGQAPAQDKALCIPFLDAASAGPYSQNRPCLTSQQVLPSAFEDTILTVASWHRETV